MSATKRVKCGLCYGQGYETHCDGVGGRWQEKCSQCTSSGEVVVADQPVDLVRATCLACGRALTKPDGSPSFCDDTHELIWWRSRGELATVTKRGP